MGHGKLTPREDHRQREIKRSNESASLSEKFPELKSLTVEFGYFSPEGISRNRQIKYMVNTSRARSVFRLDCIDGECVGGDFDLSAVIAKAVAARQTTAAGKLSCQGWLSKTTIDRLYCRNILHYKFALEYGVQVPTKNVRLQGPD